MRKLLILIFGIVTVFSELHSQETSSVVDSKNDVNILFVGNSLTYTNNLPQQVKKMAKRRGVILDFEMIAFPNYAIADHWNEGKVQNLINSKSFDYVILQQGPSSQPDGRAMLLEYGKKYNALCHVNDSKLCFFMVWPSLHYYHTFEDVIKNYKDAAALNNAILLPVGQVWRDYFNKTDDFHYYDSDGFHPSKEGSYKAAEVIVAYLFKDLKHLD
ncbi:SGNH/GDSL hydrolase family protein [Aestuariivivens sediminicola]|uniref:SGNH/GDSL hydrolase family protein n=1 Tax=Aestuariivivens sediminicola TaxID=2913560 RepID=UPI001F5914E3|nr:SGNH/GDSL hydrolase family protein [Aestuariivivens sediminicola]